MPAPKDQPNLPQPGSSFLENPQPEGAQPPGDKTFSTSPAVETCPPFLRCEDFRQSAGGQCFEEVAGGTAAARGAAISSDRRAPPPAIRAGARAAGGRDPRQPAGGPAPG